MQQKNKLPAYVASREPNPTKDSSKLHQVSKIYKYIPKKIFQTWEGSVVSNGMYRSVQSWLSHNLGWEYFFFDNQACLDFIKDNFDKKVLQAYDLIIPGAYQADLWRYCVLYIHGGVYGDIKQEALIGLDDVLPEGIEFLSIKDQRRSHCEFDGYIYQAFICARPKHQFLKQAIDMIVDNVNNGYYGYDVLSPSGPGLLGKSINLVLGREQLSAHKAGEHQVNNYKYVLLEAPDFSNKLCKVKIGQSREPFFLTEYASFREEQSNCFAKNVSFKYQYCWYNNKVYQHGKVVRTISDKLFKKGFKKELAGNVVRMYKRGDKSAARSEIFRLIKSGFFCWRLLEVWFVYELLK